MRLWERVAGEAKWWELVVVGFALCEVVFLFLVVAARWST